MRKRRRKRGRSELGIDEDRAPATQVDDDTRSDTDDDSINKDDSINEGIRRIRSADSSTRYRTGFTARRSQSRELTVRGGFSRTSQLPRFLVLTCFLLVVTQTLCIAPVETVGESTHDDTLTIQVEEMVDGGRETVIDLDQTIHSSPKREIIAPETKLKLTAAPLIVCMVVDGTVYTIDALTGELRSVWATGRPLVGASRPELVFPGLNGKLYVRKRQSNDNDDEDVMEALPMTIQDVLVHPVRTCLDSSQNEDEPSERLCGIVAATKVTTLFGVDTAHGQLLWTSHHGRPDDGEDAIPDNDDTESHVVLQREDFMVHHVSTTSGTEIWNVTLGRFSALDFNEPPIAGLLESGSPELQEDSRSTLVVEEDTIRLLPSIAFGKDGTTLLAVQHGNVLWRRQLHSVIASVYGIAQNRWMELDVLSEEQLLEETAHGTRLETLPMLPSPSSATSDRKDMFVDMLWQRIQQQADDRIQRLYPSTSLVLYQPKRPLDTIEGDCTADGSCQAKEAATEIELEGPKLVDQDFIPPFPGTTSYDSFGQNARPWQVQPEGLLLTWNMVVSTIFAMIGALVLAFKFYQHKKRKWTSSVSANQASDSGETTGFDREIPIMSVSSHIHRRTASLGGNSCVKRSQSLPMIAGDVVSDVERTPELKMSARSERWKSGPTTEVPTIAQTASEGTSVNSHLPSHLDGIPLVRYSRYKSEFTEVQALGKGGFGTVFQCQNVLDGRHYAMKKIAVKTYQNPQVTKEQLERVLREVKILALLDHPNIVRYYTAWLEMEAENDQTASVLDDSYLDSYKDSLKDTSRWKSKCYSSEFLTNGDSMIRDRPSEMDLHREKSSNNPLGWNNFLDEYSMSSMRRPRPLTMDDSVDSDFEFQDTSTGISSDNVKSVIRASLARKGSSNLRSIQSDEDLSFHDEDSSARFQDEAKATPRVSPTEARKTKAAPPMRHTLYIQMQFCSGKSLQDFLLNPQARKGTRVRHDTTSSVDIPLALNLFGQIAQGVKHVHAQGLIHRDLKPSNCFMDGNSVVKVGDFGLSRSSAAANEETILEPDEGVGANMDQTAGVGTRSYASPEQMKGSDYDAATDVYSLAIILFELCYPMYTGMERTIVFTNLRKRIFPKEWMAGMADAFPAMHDMMCKMLSNDPGKRPSSSQVASTMERILSEFTVLSIDKVHREAILLRVESETKDSILQTTMGLIRSSAPSIQIEQYGLRSGTSNTSVMEFALSFGGDDEDETGESLRQVLDGLKCHEDIKGARQVSSTLPSSAGPRI